MKLLDLHQKYMHKKVQEMQDMQVAPIFVGGGVAHGPKGELSYKKENLIKVKRN